MYSTTPKVNMPQFGSEVAPEPTETKSYIQTPDTFQKTNSATRKQIKDISFIGIKFEESVVRERCFDALPYDPKYLNEVLDSSQIITPKPKVFIFK